MTAQRPVGGLTDVQRGLQRLLGEFSLTVRVSESGGPLHLFRGDIEDTSLFL